MRSLINVHGVAVEFLNEDTTLADKGLMRVSGEEDVTVDPKLKFPRRLAYSFDTSQIRLVCDLSSVTYAGKQSVSYNILLPSGVSTRDVSVESPTVRTVQIEIGELSKKDIEIRCNVVGNVAEGYIAGTVELLPETLEVRGQQSDIMRSATRRSRSTSRMRPRRSWNCSITSCMTSTIRSSTAKTSIP